MVSKLSLPCFLAVVLLSQSQAAIMPPESDIPDCDFMCCDERFSPLMWTARKIGDCCSKEVCEHTDHNYGELEGKDQRKLRLHNRIGRDFGVCNVDYCESPKRWKKLEAEGGCEKDPLCKRNCNLESFCRNSSAYAGLPKELKDELLQAADALYDVDRGRRENGRFCDVRCCNEHRARSTDQRCCWREVCRFYERDPELSKIIDKDNACRFCKLKAKYKWSDLGPKLPAGTTMMDHLRHLAANKSSRIPHCVCDDSKRAPVKWATSGKETSKRFNWTTAVVPPVILVAVMLALLAVVIAVRRARDRRYKREARDIIQQREALDIGRPTRAP